MLRLIVIVIILSPFVSARAQSLNAVVDDSAIGSTPLTHAYSGTWVNAQNESAFYLGTLSYSNTTGSYFTFTFSGIGFEWWGEKLSTHGIAGVSVDGMPETLVDLYSSVVEKVLIFSRQGLPLATHVVKIRVTGQKNARSTGYFVVHDYFRVTGSGGVQLRNESTSLGEGSGAAGTDNVAVGFNALHDPLSGNQNTAVGAYTQQKNVHGMRNTAVGYHAMSKVINGRSSNTAIGASALDNADVGTYNTALGAGAGIAPTVRTMVSNSTAIGAGALVTGSNQVRIGNAATTSIGGVVSWSTLSDGRFKRDIKSDVAGLDFINKLRPVSYLVDRDALDAFTGPGIDSADDGKAKVRIKERDIRHSGFIAQEVEAVVNESTFAFNGVDAPEGENDTYTIRYAEFVVPLVRAVQELTAIRDEQQKIIEEQRRQIDQLVNKLNKVSPAGRGASLLQNSPNPFSGSTDIGVVLPEGTRTASIIVYDVKGRRMKTILLDQRGSASVSLGSQDLAPGIYLYSLTVDGDVVDTKRMVVKE